MMQTVINVAKKNKLEHEILNARQIKERFPAFNKPTFQNDYIGLYQRDAGILNASECVNTLQVLALQNKNITIREHQKVIQIVSNSNEYKHLITIQPTDGHSYQVYTKKIVLCLGSWTSKFLRESVPNKVSLNLNSKSKTQKLIL
jgi:glycine/D-amino acid oxidase-like deaminating enzyme